MSTQVEKLQSCHKCYLSSTASNKEKGIPAGWGQGKKILILGLSPGDSREPTLYAMKPTSASDTAKIIMDCITEIGLTENDFYITNLVKCSFPNNVNDYKIFDICYNEWLIEELIKISPNKIICLGEDVYNFITQKSLVTEVFEVYKVWHHAYIARSRDKYEEWVRQWRISLY